MVEDTAKEGQKRDKALAITMMTPKYTKKLAEVYSLTECSKSRCNFVTAKFKFVEAKKNQNK